MTMAAETLCAVPTLPEALRGVASYGADLIADGEGEDVFIVDRLIGETDVVMLKGHEKTAKKTWLALAMSVSVILGKSWLGFHVERRAPRFVLFVSAETTRRNISKRLRALCKGIGVPVERVAPYLVVIDQPITMIPRHERERTRAKKFRDTRLAGVKSFDSQKSKVLLEGARELADSEEDALGENLALLKAIEDADEGTWSLVVLDTLRECLDGDENSSKDGGRFMKAARALARSCACPVVPIHHTNKGGDETDARSSRGTTALTASPDVIVSIDTSGAHPTLHFLCRNVESPPSVGYELVTLPDDGGVRLEAREASAPTVKGDAVTAEDVLGAFELTDVEALTESTLRGLVAQVRGLKKGSKVSPAAVRRHLVALEKTGAVSRAEVEQSKGDPLPAWVLGPDGGTFPAVPVTKGRKRDDEEENPFKAPRLPGVR